MRIVYIAAGAAGMYCGACNRDVALVRGLIARGHHAQIIPLYTPLRIDGSGELETSPVFFGGINVFLQQVLPVARRAPAFLDRWLDNPSLLNWVSRFAIKTRAQELGPMTVSVLAGNRGRQHKELRKLMAYLEQGPRPDVVNITNSLLSAIAPALKERFGVPVLCTLQGEDGFVDAMPEPYMSLSRRLMQRNAEAIDLFISPGEAYAREMAEYLAVPEERVRVICTGIDARPFASSGRTRNPFTIGYLSAIAPIKGLDILIDALAMLVRKQQRDVALRVAGRVLNEDYWRKIKAKVSALALGERVHYIGEIDFREKVAFFQQCSIFSLPSRAREARGVAVMEAMASGSPVVVPDTGVFPELIARTGGGVTFPSEDTAALADAIARLIDEPVMADEIGRSGAEAITKLYSVDQMAEQTLKEYADLIARAKS